MQYWDTSTLLKLFVPETDSQVFAAHLSASAICISQVGQAEMLRAGARKELEGAIPALSAETVFEKFLADVSAGRLVILPFDARIEAHFRTLVLRFHRQTPPADEVVTMDNHMRAGAAALGLRLFP